MIRILVEVFFNFKYFFIEVFRYLGLLFQFECYFVLLNLYWFFKVLSFIDYCGDVGIRRMWVVEFLGRICVFLYCFFVGLCNWYFLVFNFQQVEVQCLCYSDVYLVVVFVEEGEGCVEVIWISDIFVVFFRKCFLDFL